MKKGLVIIWLVLLLGATGALFWYNDWVYQLPTPVPPDYKPVSLGTPIKLNGIVKQHGTKPVFLHFFNPKCPCSKFNITHFKTLVKQYNKQVDFVVVVVSPNTYTESEIQDKFGLNLPVLFNASLAESCGVYSTPQAAIIDNSSRLYYRGNYNRTRYCTDEKTSYAKIALKGLLDNTQMAFSPLALQAYGCSFPDNCKY